MFRLLVILFVIKLCGWTDIFKRIKKKHGQSVLNVGRKLENVETKIIKLQEDINFIKTCKREHLILTFASVKLAELHQNSSNFTIKDITKKEHKHDLVYSVKRPEETCNETYNGETGRRLINELTQPAFICPKLTTETLEQGVKYVQSKQ